MAVATPPAQQSAPPKASRYLVQAGGVGALILAILAAVAIPAGCGLNHCAGYALGNSLVLRLERGAAVLLAGLAVLLVVGRVIVEGLLPDNLSSTGVGFSEEAVQQGVQGVAWLSDAFDKQDEEVERLKQDVPTLARSVSAALTELNERLSALETRDNGSTNHE